MNEKLPKRNPNRLNKFDYSQNGAYFITICTKDRKCILSDIVGEDIILPKKIILKPYGKITENAISLIEQRYNNISVDKYVIMPNHIHLIIRINRNDGKMISSPTISTIVGQMKRYVSKECKEQIWQKSFHDHIIRNERDYLDIWQYIDGNALKWQDDKFYNKRDDKNG